MKVRTKDRELLTSRGWINAGWTVDLPYEEARHLIGLGRVEPVDPVDDAPVEQPRPAGTGPVRKNNALPRQFTR